MTKKQHYMTYPERVKLETMLRFKAPISQIARELGCCRQTIYNEMQQGKYEHERNGFLEKRYSADKSQQVHNKNQGNKGRTMKIGNDIAYANFLEQKILMEKRSPAAALAEARKAGYTTSICTATLYAYIDQGIFYALTNNQLWEKPKRKKRADKPAVRVAHKNLPSIEQRPQHIAQRQEVGHWEMDLVVGITGSRAALLTLTERITREEIIIKLPDKTSASVVAAINRLERRTTGFRKKFHSITTDNGPEFLNYTALCTSIYGGKRFNMWYCHSYASWEKGTNERNNRIIRRWFPKGTDFTNVSQKQIQKVQDWMNNYPRKVLSWMSPIDFTA